jgi:uncharacterized membrane protein YhaH (DUF805 family)
MDSGFGAARPRNDVPPGPTTMQATSFLFSPNGRLRPAPFIYGAAAVYLAGLASHLLTTPHVITRAGLWPFVAGQILLIWIWFALHSKRLHDAGRGNGLAVGVAVLYALSVLLLLIVADSFFNTSDGPMMDANATGALGLILVLYIISALAGSTQYDLAWVVVAILTLMALVPVIAALGLTLWSANQPSVVEKS